MSEEGLLKPCVWGSAMQPRGPGRRDGRVIAQARAWLGAEGSDKELQLKDQRCMGGGKLWSWGCGNQVLHPQLFHGAILLVSRCKASRLSLCY